MCASYAIVKVRELRACEGEYAKSGGFKTDACISLSAPNMKFEIN